MPASGWNGKFQGMGNGGFAGAISYVQLAQAMGRGYAVASTDTGHKGDVTDASWALGHPEKVIDFGHRAIHEMTVKAKAVIAAFYGCRAPFLFRRLLQWRPAGADGSAALPGRLRRDRGGCARGRVDALHVLLRLELAGPGPTVGAHSAGNARRAGTGGRRGV